MKKEKNTASKITSRKARGGKMKISKNKKNSDRKNPVRQKIGRGRALRRCPDRCRIYCFLFTEKSMVTPL